jgi:hypothetical protein
LHVSPVRLFVAAAAAVLFPTLALAQTPGPLPVQEGRIPVGEAFSITPAFVFVAGHDTNAIRTNTGTPAQEFYGVPQLEGWLGRGRTRLNFASAVELSQQQGQQNGVQDVRVRTVNQYYVARLDVGGPRIAFQAVGGWRNHYAPPTDFVGFELGIKSRRIETESGAQVSVRPGGRVSLIGLVNLGRLRYDAEEVFEGSSLQQNLNRNITLYGGEMQIAVTPLTSLGASVQYFTDRFLYASERDGNGLRAMAGATFQPLALIAGRADFGYMKYKAIRVGTDYGGPAYNVGLSFTRAPFFFDVSGRRTIEFSFDPSQGFYVSDGIDFFGTIALGNRARWEMFGRAQVRSMEPRGPLATREPFRGLELYKGGLVRRFGDILRIGADIERYVTGGPGGFDGVRSTIFMILGGSTRLQRLDRPLPGGY